MIYEEFCKEGNHRALLKDRQKACDHFKSKQKSA